MLDDGVPVWLDVGLRLAVALDDGVPVRLDVELRLAVALDDGVFVRLDVELRLAVALDDGVPVWLDVEPLLAVKLDDDVLVWVDAELRLADLVLLVVADTVRDEVPVTDSVRVAERLPVPVRVAVPLPVLEPVAVAVVVEAAVMELEPVPVCVEVSVVELVRVEDVLRVALRVVLLEGVPVRELVRLLEGLTTGVQRGDFSGRTHEGSTLSVPGGEVAAPKHARSPRRLKPHTDDADGPEDSASSRLAPGVPNEAGGTMAPSGHAPMHAALPFACRKQLCAAPSAAVTMLPA